MSSQLGRRLAVLSNIVHASQVLGLAGVAFWAHTIALDKVTSCGQTLHFRGQTYLGLALPAAFASN